MGHHGTHRDQKSTDGKAEGREGLSAGSTANLTIAANSDAKGCADHELHRAGVGLFGSRRKQQDHDRGEGYGRRAIWPCGHDPEKLGRADGDERAPSIDQRRQPIGHVQPELRRQARGRPDRVDQQRQPVEHVQKPASNLAVWSASSRSDGVPAGRAMQRSPGRVTDPAQADRDRSSSRAEAPASGADRSSGGRLRRTASASCRAVPSGNRAELRRNRAPGGESREQTRRPPSAARGE